MIPKDGVRMNTTLFEQLQRLVGSSPMPAQGMANCAGANVLTLAITDTRGYLEMVDSDASTYGCYPRLCDRCRCVLPENWKYACCEKCGKECPHGNPPADCNECMIESDMAFDAAREQRHSAHLTRKGK